MPPPGRGRGRGHHHHHAPGPAHPAHPHRPHRPVVHHPAPVQPVVHHPPPVVHRPPPEPVVVFERLYHFKVNGKEVVIQHSLGKNLRVRLADDSLDYEGGVGQLARWKVHLHENGKVIQLQSIKTGKYLRVKPNGNDFDVQGIPRGPYTFFIVEPLSTGVIHLKTKETFHGNKHAYLAVLHGNLPQKRLTFYIEGAPRSWEKGYLFAAKNVCVLQHSGLDNIRCAADGTLHANGQHGDEAQWEVMPDHNTHTVQLRNKKHGGYLRIKDEGKEVNALGKGGKFTVFKVHHIGEEKNYVKLESVVFPGKFVAVDQHGVRVGVGGKFCALTFYKE